MKYKRLTKRNEQTQDWDFENFIVETQHTLDWCNQEIGARLCELEDKIEKGKLIELPCKVGDTVYGFSCYRQFGGLKGKIFRGKVIAFYIERGLFLRLEAENDNGNFYLEYGKDVFLTREEAEKRLKERQE